MNKITGFEELAEKLNNILKTTKKVENETLVEAAQPIADTAKSLAPRRTGRGAESIHVGPVQEENNEKFVRIGPGGEGWHLIFQELGTSHHPAQPFLRPAFDQHESEARKIIGDRLGRTIEKEAKK